MQQAINKLNPFKYSQIDPFMYSEQSDCLGGERAVEASGWDESVTNRRRFCRHDGT